MKKSTFNLILIMNIIYGLSFSQNSMPSNATGNWENVYNGDISNNGKWSYFLSEYQTVSDTLTVMSVSGNKKYKIPWGSEGMFTKDSKYFTAFTNNNQLKIIDFQKDSITTLKDIGRRYFSADERFLILKKSSRSSCLLIKNLSLGTEISIPQVVEFRINPLKNEVALIMENEGEFNVSVLNLNSYTIRTLKEKKDYQYNDITWSEDGQYLAMLESKLDEIAKEQKILRCSGIECVEITIGDMDSFSKLLIDKNSLNISKNGDLIYFKSTAPTTNDTIYPTGVQLWKTTDKWIYPRRKINNRLTSQPILWSWKPQTNKIIQISDSVLTEVIKINSDFILKYDLLSYEPQYEYIPPVDIFLQNINTNHSQLLLEKLKPNQVFISPDKNEIVFFKNENWWRYNLIEQKFINLTKNLDVSFRDINNDNDSKKIPFSNHIKWVEEENAILVCDEFDVWKFGLDGKVKERLTHGREINRTYRFFIDHLNLKKINQNSVNLENGFLLEATDQDRNSGYFLWQPNGTLKKLCFGAFLADDIKWNEQMNYFTFRIQSYSLPPKIHFFNRSRNSAFTIFESNKDQILKKWGNAVLLPFKLSTGENSKVALIYPVNYNPSKKYPMIVNIYEKQTQRMHDFYPLSWYSEVGFNPTHFALDGYFVLLPDISYNIGNVGLSADHYVNESIDFVLGKESIDKNKIGIIGHSFGGYETAFIITKNNRFATAVAGAAVTNLETFYHTIDWNSGIEEMFRFEDYQMRMGKSYFDLKTNYLNNSPFHNIESTNTPLLLWTGGNDLHINYNESIRFYLALRRLKKTAELLIFDNEGHTLSKMKNKIYLTHSIKNWMDKFCKY